MIDGYLLGLEFIKSEANSNLHYVLIDGDTFILVLHVDDHFLTRYAKLINMCKEDLDP